MNDFEKPFRDALTDLEVTPPEGGWAPIESALDRKGFDYRAYSLLLLLLLLTGVGSWVTYHVATHVGEQQRISTIGQHAASTPATLPAPATPALSTIEVPCADITPVADAPAGADAGHVPAGGGASTIPDPGVEIACTPRVDAGEVYAHALAGHDGDKRQLLSAIHATGDEAAPVGIGAARNRVIRRRRQEETTPATQRPGQTKTVVAEDVSSIRKRPRQAPATTADQPARRAEESTVMARTSGVAQQASDTVYARASHIDGKEPAGRGHDAGAGEGAERDSVIRAHNGPPMPMRKRMPSPDGLALTPLDSLKRLREAEKKTRVSKRDSVEEKKRSERKRSNWSLQVEAGANYTFKKMDPARDLYYVTGLNNKNRPSWRNTGYQLGATVRYTVARRTTMTAGVSWNMLREHTDYNYYNIIADSVEVQQIAGKSIEVNAYSKVRRNDVTNTLHYLGVHVGLIQQVTFLRHERNILLGLHVNRQIAATNRTQNADHRFMLNDMRIALRAGLENRITLSPDYILTLTPFLEQSFGSVYSQESVYTLRPIQVGLNAGLILPFYRRR